MGFQIPTRNSDNLRSREGAIKVSSEVGKGTTFKILFSPTAQDDISPVPKGDSDAEWEKWQGSGTVLIADDEERWSVPCPGGCSSKWASRF